MDRNSNIQLFNKKSLKNAEFMCYNADTEMRHAFAIQKLSNADLYTQS